VANYSIPELQTGTYQLTVKKSGFETLTVNNVVVEISGERESMCASQWLGRLTR